MPQDSQRFGSELGHMRVVTQVCQRLQGVNAGSIELSDLRLPDICDPTQVIVAFPNLLAPVCPGLRTLCAWLGVGCDRVALLRFQEAFAKRLVVADVLGNTIGKPRSIPKHNTHPRGQAPLPPCEDRGVERQLDEVFGFWTPGKLGIDHLLAEVAQI